MKTNFTYDDRKNRLFSQVSLILETQSMWNKNTVEKNE